MPNLNLEALRLPISSVVLSGQRVAMSEAPFNTGRNKEARAQATNPLVEDGHKLIPSVTCLQPAETCSSTCRRTASGKVRSPNAR